ncbi:MAG: GNAT family N-acetyltransferase [Rickettsiales bacterium]|jgi:ribosomal-protein-alanine N-acetyltransferase|nr:GNAT family N-acetyltransferase [Rickettsiales bacterium]
MLNKLAELHKLCFPGRPWPASEFASLKESGAEIIASDHGFIVWRSAADECEIITIGVHPDYRGAGIASAMLALMEQDIKGKTVKIFLEVSADNRPARALYEKHGYVQVGIRPKYYNGIDAVLMQKVMDI